VVLLATATQLAHAIAWRWGFAITTIGEGLMLAAVAALLARLWQSNRRLHQQVERIDRRLSSSLGTESIPPNRVPEGRFENSPAFSTLGCGTRNRIFKSR
jgi:hypothetical protein